ncbi:MAG: hypothetical protein U0105_09450 [Candidatus Obscuribacterales bacterium]
MSIVRRQLPLADRENPEPILSHPSLLPVGYKILNMKTVRVLLFCALVAAGLLIAFAFLMDLMELRDVFVLNKELLPSALIAIVVWRGVPFAILTTLAWLSAKNNFGAGKKPDLL